MKLTWDTRGVRLQPDREVRLKADATEKSA
jgi:hypothetical protein